MTIHWLHWQDILGAAGGMAIYLFRSWLVGKAVDIGEHIALSLERTLVRTEREAVEWIHYRARAANEGHRPKWTHLCQDGRCADVTK